MSTEYIINTLSSSVEDLITNSWKTMYLVIPTISLIFHTVDIDIFVCWTCPLLLPLVNATSSVGGTDLPCSNFLTLARLPVTGTWTRLTIQRVPLFLLQGLVWRSAPRDWNLANQRHSIGVFYIQKQAERKPVFLQIHETIMFTMLELLLSAMFTVMQRKTVWRRRDWRQRQAQQGVCVRGGR